MKYRCSCDSQSFGERRQLLAMALMASVGVLVGGVACGARSEADPSVAAVDIGPGTVCELDGMALADYPGPKAQIHYAGVATPVFFCDTVEFFDTMLRPEQVRKVQAVYVQDMGKADWDQPRGNWIDAKAAIYVLGSKRRGSMGPTIASFAQESDAKSFATQWGGRLLGYGDITPAMADLTGGALHDTKM